MIYNLDEPGYGDWEERRKFAAIAPAGSMGTPIQHPYPRKSNMKQYSDALMHQEERLILSWSRQMSMHESLQGWN
jgi:hypothetical protein